VLGRFFEPLYRSVVSHKNAEFDRGRGVHKFDVPVVSIGNLSVGGTGKTPLVMHTLRVLLQAGAHPCVAMRGYGRRGGETPDEVDAYEREFPGLSVVARPDRAVGLKELLGGNNATRSVAVPDCVVLDDGFQHRQIARDLDVVLIDATPGRSVFADRCLPAGWLREPVESLGRASMVMLTHAELATVEHLEALKREVAKRTGAPIAVARHVWAGLKQRANGEDRRLPLDALIGKRVVGCCAIGHPEAFFASLERTVGQEESVERLAYPDHDALGPGRVRAIEAMARASKSELIVVTDKDWSKLRRVPETEWPCPVVRPELAVVFDSGRAEFERLVLGAVGKGGS
jgi:tetraacyldisaccharide 4'-kinase